MRSAVLLLFLMWIGSPAEARRFGGREPFDFLFLDAGAMQASMGGAFAAGAGDANALAYNPAGLAAMEEHHVSLMRNSLFADARRDHIAAATRSGLGITIDSVQFGSLQRTTLSDPDGDTLGSFSPSALSAAVGLGMQAGEIWSWGVAARHTREEIDGARASALSFDVGVQLHPSDDPPWRLGLSVQNIGGRTRFESESEPLPLNIRWGGALRLGLFGQGIGLVADAEQDPDGGFLLHAGATTVVAEILTLRTGYSTRNDAGLGMTGGFGIGWQGLTFDYALVPFGDLGTAHWFTLGLRWGPEALESGFTQRISQ